MQEQPITMQDGTQLDPKVVKVMQAIRQVESGGDYNAIGDNGNARGAYQFNEKTGPGWKNLAKQYLGDENAQFDKANQNKVAYKRIKEWKDAGRQPEEIAALWNGARKENGVYVYNKPEYGVKFREALTGTQTTQQAITPQETAPQEQGLGEQLKERGQYIGSAMEDLAKNLKGEQGSEAWWANVLHIAGGTAGGLGDIIGAGLELIPGVKQAEKWVGDKVADSEVGKEVAKHIQQFQKDYPEAAKLGGDVFNIVTAIPILKGLAVLKNVGTSSLRKVVMASLKSGVKADLEEAVGRQVSKKATEAILKNGLVNVEKKAFGQGAKQLVYTTSNIGYKELQRVVPKEVLGEVVNIMEKVPGKFWTPGAVAKSVESMAPTIGGMIGYTAGGPIGAGAGAVGTWASKKAIRGGIKKTVQSAFDISKRTLPSVGRTAVGGTGLLGGVMAQKASREKANVGKTKQR